MARTLAIGDIHGCSAALQTILSALDPGPEDTIVTLGDYIDRGPDSRGVIEQLLELDRVCRLKPLLGNHEIMLLAALEDRSMLRYWLACGGTQTVESYGGFADKIPGNHLDFIRICRRWYEEPGHFFVHANYDPRKPLADQDDETLFWHHLTWRVPAPHESGKIAVVGHTPQESGEILDLGHLLCIDTGCFAGGWLTAIDVHSRQVWQAGLQGELRPKVS